MLRPPTTAKQGNMGRKPWSSRLTTQDCLCLSATELHRTGVFKSRTGSPWRWSWSRPSGSELTLDFTIVEAPGRALGLQLDCAFGVRFSGIRIVEITTTKPFLGGRRYWFLCPFVRDGIRCGRRVGRLYLPPSQQLFGCRRCYDLTYQSSQRHDKRLDAFRREPAALLVALRSTNRKERLAAVRAFAKVVGIMNTSLRNI